MSAVARRDPMRRALRELLRGEGAHVPLDAAVAGLPAHLRGTRPAGLPYAVWELVEHMRIGQEDLVAYTLSAEHDVLPWPDGYWPAARDPVPDAVWEASLQGLRAALAEMEGWLDDPAFELLADIPHSDALPDGGRRTPMRQILIAADHLAYHVGQIVAARRALGAW